MNIEKLVTWTHWYEWFPGASKCIILRKYWLGYCKILFEDGTTEITTSKRLIEID